MKNINDIPLELPREYRMPLLPILPESIDFVIPGFEKSYPLGMSKTLALKKRNCEQWYNEFVDRVVDACGHRYLPICRMSDGEFLFFLGAQPIDIRLSFVQKCRQQLSKIKERLVLKGGLGPFTEGHYHSGEYSADEWRKARKEQPQMIRKISEKGILALHLNYVRAPFAERYYPELSRWLLKSKILLNDDNYYPFYFIYAFLTGPRRGELLKNRRVLVVRQRCTGRSSAEDC